MTLAWAGVAAVTVLVAFIGWVVLDYALSHQDDD